MRRTKRYKLPHIMYLRTVRKLLKKLGIDVTPLELVQHLAENRAINSYIPGRFSRSKVYCGFICVEDYQDYRATQLSSEQSVITVGGIKDQLDLSGQDYSDLIVDRLNDLADYAAEVCTTRPVKSNGRATPKKDGFAFDVGLVAVSSVYALALAQSRQTSFVPGVVMWAIKPTEGHTLVHVMMCDMGAKPKAVTIDDMRLTAESFFKLVE